MSYAITDKRPRHGLRYHPLYGRWLGMVQRCNDPNHERYAQYGGKGVRVCERWRSFPNFLADMGVPEAGMTIERLDGSGDYEPGNCIWATIADQNRNKSSNRFYELNGKRQCITDWAKDLGISESTLRERLTKWPESRALSTPKQKGN